MIVASHDFDEPPPTREKSHHLDWATYQIETATDINVVGIPQVDCYLTAGLGQHRVHHVLPV